jgi:hypothetical protein
MPDYIPQLITGATGLLGTLIGGLITYGIQNRTRSAVKRDEQIGLAQAVSAEIGAYLRLIGSKKHDHYISGLIEANKAGTEIIPKTWASGFERSYEPLPILKANIHRIGILGALAQDVATFYSRVQAVRTSMAAAESGDYDTAKAKDLAFILESDLELWKNADSLGRWLVSALLELASDPTKDPKRPERLA